MSTNKSPFPFSELVFLPFPKGIDEEQFVDYDSAEGLSYCVYVKGGLVTHKSHKKEYKDLLKAAVEFFSGDE